MFIYIYLSQTISELIENDRHSFFIYTHTTTGALERTRPADDFTFLLAFTFIYIFMVKK